VKAYFLILRRVAMISQRFSSTTFSGVREWAGTKAINGSRSLPSPELTLLAQPRKSNLVMRVPGHPLPVLSTMNTTSTCSQRVGDLNLVSHLVKTSGKELMVVQLTNLC